jgi:hypothetical protein
MCLMGSVEEGSREHMVTHLFMQSNARTTSGPDPITHNKLPRFFDPSRVDRNMAEWLKSANGGSLSTRELSDQYRLAPSTVQAWRSGFRIISWRNALGFFYYPRWQFDKTGALLPGTEDVLKLFKSHDGRRGMRYFSVTSGTTKW